LAILNPDHLFEQAEKLIGLPAAGRPREADLRRAVSSAYYGVFHAILAAAADEAVGAARRSTVSYALAYRSVDHRALRALCMEVQKATLSAKYRPYEPAGGFSRFIRAVAASVVELQDARYAADYDPLIFLKRSDASLAVRTARRAVRRFGVATAQSRRAFLALLLFPPR
jgi:hypothetical protein